MSRPVLKCARCSRRFRDGAADADRWNCQTEGGRVVAVLCPACQSDAEDIEAQVNLAMLDYLGPGPDGLLRARPKLGGTR